ncbi:tRNA selenocysteine 1-associated protein 1-like isoform X3 [Hypanus sabinus]|uniref:tRNA selenocysteine 1-associated protein 1-like isoform X3 n=1 Tax=Hypanus sabinus TaxID=79690 RepID=UPI0028C4FECB|nr:tRNA selenocysteine 1-associated protein 1-like isoform X3 [Hypanus sabinus]
MLSLTNGGHISQMMKNNIYTIQATNILCTIVQTTDIVLTFQDLQLLKKHTILTIWILEYKVLWGFCSPQFQLLFYYCVSYPTAKNIPYLWATSLQKLMIFICMITLLRNIHLVEVGKWLQTHLETQGLTRTPNTWTDGTSDVKGFGFVRFSDEAEQKKALEECQNSKGLGGKPIRISIAVPKSAKTKSEYQPTASYNYTQYYQQYQQYYSQWCYDPYASYGYGYPQYGATETSGITSSLMTEMSQLSEFQQNTTLSEENEEECVEDPDPKLDIDEVNKQFMEQSEELYESLMNCHWQPLDSITSEIPSVV